jgi:hypothetical protein
MEWFRWIDIPIFFLFAAIVMDRWAWDAFRIVSLRDALPTARPPRGAAKIPAGLPGLFC